MTEGTRDSFGHPGSLVPSVILVPKRRKTKRRIRLGTDIGSFGWFLRSEPMYIWPDSIRLLTEGTSEGTAHYFPIWDNPGRRGRKKARRMAPRKMARSASGAKQQEINDNV